MVSETRKRRPDPAVVGWLQGVDPGEIYVSVLTIGELAKGIAKRRESDPAAADDLAHWLRGIELLFADRVLPVDNAVAMAWGELSVRRSLPVIDSLLAATATVHGLTVASRNVRDFERSGVALLNPWDSR